MADAPQVTIGLLAWNGATTLPACLESVLAQRRVSWELVALDNGSRDGSDRLLAAWCAQHLPPNRWRLVFNRTNRGYAAGMNAIYARSGGAYLCALNQDVALHPDYLATLIEGLERQTNWASAIGRIYRSAQLPADYVSLARAGDPIGWGRGRTLDSTGHLLYPERIAVNRRGGEIDGGQDQEEAEVFGVPGMCPVYRRAALEAIRMPNGWIWDERFFAYLEDVDLDYRFRTAGWSAGYVPSAVAIHQPHGSGGRATFGVRFRGHMNRYRLLAKHEAPRSLL
ncbi:MAG TPA: glycosyltransferase family 2 protein, partial [bacterium]|nr:glycosyltransferase family 2 protein [bacterium]